MEPTKRKLGEDEVAEALKHAEPLQTEPTCPICGWEPSEIRLFPDEERRPEIRASLLNHALFHIAVSLHRDEPMTQAMERELAQQGWLPVDEMALHVFRHFKESLPFQPSCTVCLELAIARGG